ncbi:hypothetical protein RIF29_09185 [Crotalaria pallida]|uniref:Guanosine nucleotide diphosphate dissociation inhibitor n=1 Tax=Crotalaria pallida TaxID=3830 RepID=A0AAN9IJC3_CROPI
MERPTGRHQELEGEQNFDGASMEKRAEHRWRTRSPTPPTIAATVVQHQFDLKPYSWFDSLKLRTKNPYLYLFCCSYAHNVAPKGKYIAFVTSEAETDQPEVELKPGIDLGPVDEIFYDIYDRYEPTNDHQADGCFISTSYDATPHFETTLKDVIEIYSKITGKVISFLIF